MQVLRLHFSFFTVMNPDFSAALYRELEKLVTENKKLLIEAALENRTRYVAVVLEHILKPHNASAVLRTVEALGLQEFYMIAPKKLPDNADATPPITKDYEANPGIVKGAIKWINVHNFSQPNTDNTVDCLTALKSKGYAIVVTSPHAQGFFPEQLPVDKPLALVFGNEQEGVSASAKSSADYFLQIPMWGFTESYNLSVSAAICLYTLMNRIRMDKLPWQLSEEEKMELRLVWYRKLVRRSAIIESELLRNYDH